MTCPPLARAALSGGLEHPRVLNLVAFELEEAGRVAGASWTRALVDIAAPLLKSGMIAAWVMVFAVTLRELSMAILLYVRGTETLPVAESARRMLMGIYGRRFPAPDGSRGRSAIFAGKSADGEPRQGHGHAYYLPTDEDGDGRLDHLTIVAGDGFGKEELTRWIGCGS